VSGRGAAVLAIGAIILLGALAMWLVNVPLWGIVLAVAVATWLARALVRRLLRSADRQKTET
jgi:ABC-type bacteriocin/lantibiotic exporter with double-glycine peptidase domain